MRFWRLVEALQSRVWSQSMAVKQSVSLLRSAMNTDAQRWEQCNLCISFAPSAALLTTCFFPVAATCLWSCAISQIHHLWLVTGLCKSLLQNECERNDHACRFRSIIWCLTSCRRLYSAWSRYLADPSFSSCPLTLSAWQPTWLHPSAYRYKSRHLHISLLHSWLPLVMWL